MVWEQGLSSTFCESEDCGITFHFSSIQLNPCSKVPRRYAEYSRRKRPELWCGSVGIVKHAKNQAFGNNVSMVAQSLQHRYLMQMADTRAADNVAHRG